jgi:hypothetical protein
MVRGAFKARGGRRPTPLNAARWRGSMLNLNLRGKQEANYRMRRSWARAQGAAFFLAVGQKGGAYALRNRGGQDAA